MGMALKTDVCKNEETKKPNIPRKFVNNEFVGFLSCLLSLHEDDKVTKRRPIKGEGSLQELANDYQLLILHSTDLGDILRLFGKMGFVRINLKENCIHYRTQDIARLKSAIEQELLGKPRSAL
jgi:hypothetical protein